MKIGLRAGHSPNCMGAIGFRNEWKCMDLLYMEVEKILLEYNHEVINCNSKAYTEFKELEEGAFISNENNCDIFISLHMNSYNGDANGVECIVHPNARKQIRDIAEKLCVNYSSLGLKNRGVKERMLKEMKIVNAPNIIFETMFCDNKHDIEEVWAKTPWELLASSICNAIDPNIPIIKESMDKEVLYRVYSNDKHIGSFKEIKNILNNVENEIKKGVNTLRIEKVN